MLHLLDETLETFLRAAVPLPQRDVDVAFDAPDGEWAAALSSRPTVDLYLWDIRPNLAERDFGEVIIEEDGRRFRRDPLPRVDCRYLVTAWTSEVRDEHSLLGDVLSALLVHPVIDVEHLQGVFASVRPPPSLHLRSGDGTENSDFWSALGGQLKPGLDLVVTVTVDAAMRALAGPNTEDLVVRATRRAGTVAAAAAAAAGNQSAGKGAAGNGSAGKGAAGKGAAGGR
jgi:Pvc16 N-terminal domain